MRSEESGEKRTEIPSKSPLLASESNWWVFCVAIVVLKFLLLALDPSPKLFLGDSLSYIWTALSGWIPEDRSYFYGYVIRWLSVWTCSLTSVWTCGLTSLLIVQVFLGAVIAITVAWICRAIFSLPERLSYLFGFFCCIDPLQLAWERYIMTETFSLFFYALVLQQSFVYLRDRRITTLVIIQFLSVITIGFRMVFLIVVQVMVFALPLIAFLSGIQRAGTAVAVRSRWHQLLKRTVFWRHLAASVVAMFVFDQGYRHAYGFLAHREPAHLYGSGYFLLSIWAPDLQPQDAPDPRLAEIIQHGGQFRLRNFSLRSSQAHSDGYLIDRWCRAETNRRKSSRIATRTAIHAFRRDPAAIIGLAAKTYFAFWGGRGMERRAKLDLGDWILNDFQRRDLAERFHWEGRADVGSEPQTFTKWYYVAASPYYFVLLLSPLLSLVLLFVARKKAHAWLLFVHTAVMFAGTLLLSIEPITRYLQPLSLLTLLSLALAVTFIRQKDGSWKIFRYRRVEYADT